MSKSRLGFGSVRYAACVVVVCASAVVVLLFISANRPNKVKVEYTRKKQKMTIQAPTVARTFRETGHARHAGHGVVVDKGRPEIEAMRANSVAFNLSGVNIDQMTNNQVVMTFHSYLDNADTVCRRKLRMGNQGDGGWDVCDDESVRPVPPCLVYSFGINNDWSFDDDVSRVYGCQVRAFDPSMNMDNHNRSKLIQFYSWGIGGKSSFNSQGWHMYTLTDIRSRLGHTSTPLDVLKMDIEFSEWSTLADIVRTDQLTSVRQLLLEFHFEQVQRGDRSRLKTIQAIERAGFHKFYSHKNMACPKRVRGFPVIMSACYEVHYINKRLRRA